MVRPVSRPGNRTPQTSVLDRLLLGGEFEAQSRSAGVQRLREAVRRDLEALFNTRPLCRSWSRGLTELNRSILAYGLPDLHSRTIITDTQRDALRREVEAVIRRFEPRLRAAAVEFVTGANPLDRSLRFRIHGSLILEAGSEAVIYDTQIDPASREIRIAAAERDKEA